MGKGVCLIFLQIKAALCYKVINCANEKLPRPHNSPKREAVQIGGNLSVALLLSLLMGGWGYLSPRRAPHSDYVPVSDCIS